MANPLEMSYTSASTNAYPSEVRNAFNDTKCCYEKTDNPIEPSLINICEMYKNDFENEDGHLNVSDADFYKSYGEKTFAFDKAEKAKEDVSSIKNILADTKKTVKNVFSGFKNLISK